MPLHLIKLAVGCDSVKELQGWVAERMEVAKRKGLPRHHIHITRMTPKRDTEILAGGVAVLGHSGQNRRAGKTHCYRAVPRSGRHRAVPSRHAAEGDCGVAAAGAA